MIALGCIATALTFAGLLFGASHIVGAVSHLFLGHSVIRRTVRNMFIGSMDCRLLARSMGSDLLD